MRFASVFDLGCHFGARHSAFFHNARACRVCFECAGEDLIKSFCEKVGNNGSQSLGGKALVVIVRMQSVADLDRLAADLGIVHKNAAAHKKSQFTLALNKLA